MSYQPQIQLHHLSYIFTNGQTLFEDISQVFARAKIGLVGRNGIGKSILMQILAGQRTPSSGNISVTGKVFYVAQTPPRDIGLTIAELLGYHEKIAALRAIINGSVEQKYFDTIGDDWDIEDQLATTLAEFGLANVAPSRLTASLSGGELTRLQLMQAFTSDADFLLLDEPSNHLDSAAKQILMRSIVSTNKGVIMISHDRQLLNVADQIAELSSLGLNIYGGNYTDYLAQKTTEITAAKDLIQARKEINLKAKRMAQVRRERHEQNQAKGRREKAAQLQAKGSYDKMAMKAAKGRSEKTNKRIRLQAERKIAQVDTDLTLAKKRIEHYEEIHIQFPKTNVPAKKVLLDIQNLNFNYPGSQHRIISNFNFHIQGPERIALAGVNGSGKTTLVKIILGQLQPSIGEVHLGTDRISYLDQTASQLIWDKTVLENFLLFNPDKSHNQAHACLAQFSFRNTSAQKNVSSLSGGEKLRALLACILMSEQPPQLLILDEPTNHLDLNSIEKIEAVLKNFEGAMLIISHDQHFLQNTGVGKVLTAPFGAD